MIRTESGLYRGFQQNNAKNLELELRIDVNGNRPLMIISGDIFSKTIPKKYLWSFLFTKVKRKVTNNRIELTSKQGKFSSNSNKFSEIIVNIHTKRDQIEAEVNLKRARGTDLQFICIRKSESFRKIIIENDYEEDVKKFPVNKEIEIIAPNNKKIKFSIQRALFDAGIELALGEAGSNAVPIKFAISPEHMHYYWTESELHNAMIHHFSKWEDKPQWIVWMFSASRYEDPSYMGIMFHGLRGNHRQACAVFHKSIAEKKLQLYISVHELGHCFNLQHPWEKTGTSCSSSLSWMNYPWNYVKSKRLTPSKKWFWNAFRFQFDKSELSHIRHGFRNEVIFGGSEFVGGIASKILKNPSQKSSFISKNKSGLQLRLDIPRDKKEFIFGEPIVVELKLFTESNRKIEVHSLKSNSNLMNRCLHPKYEFVQIAICNCEQANQIKNYRPLFKPFLSLNKTKIDKCSPIYESAYIGFGQDGFYFKNSGKYSLCASYRALDGSIIISNILEIEIPEPKEDNKKIAKLLLDDEQGELLYLKGSDSRYLSKGNDAIDKLITQHSTHPFNVYTKFIKGYNLGREFKFFRKDNLIGIRKPKITEAEDLLSSVEELSTKKGEGIDNISLYETMIHHAKIEINANHKEKACKLRDRMINIFRKEKELNDNVMNSIENQIEKILDQEN